MFPSVLSRLLTSLVVVAFLAVSGMPARAQEPQQTLPIEVALMYDKLMKIEPNYDAYIRESGIMKEEQGQFGESALLEQQKRILKGIYDGFNDKTVFYAQKTIPLIEADQTNKVLKFTPLSSTDPILFDLTSDRTYGIFIRNAKDLEVFGAPFVYEDIVSMNTQVTSPLVDLVLKPVAVDSHQFTLENGRTVSVVLADVVEIKVYDNQTDPTRLFVQKRFKDWEPVTSALDGLYQPQP